MSWELCDCLVLLNQDFTAWSVKIHKTHSHLLVHSGVSDVGEIFKTSSGDNDVLYLLLHRVIVGILNEKDFFNTLNCVF